MAEIYELACLCCDPFQGDETDVLMLRDKFLVTREAHSCVICWDQIPAFTRVRARTELNREERKVMTFYFCVPCCRAMAENDDDKSIEARMSIGMRRAKEAAANG